VTVRGFSLNPDFKEAAMLPQAIGEETRRYFLTTPPTTAGEESPTGGLARRIWEVDADALFVVLGVLSDRRELESLFRDVTGENTAWIRHEALVFDAVSLCSTPSPFAKAVERFLDRRTRGLRRRLGGCPMSELAAWWLGAREQAGGEHLAALLWCLAKDRRWVIRGLLDRVRGDIWIRALRALGESPAHPHYRESDTCSHDVSRV
jgi:hypothetical protein